MTYPNFGTNKTYFSVYPAIAKFNASSDMNNTKYSLKYFAVLTILLCPHNNNDIYILLQMLEKYRHNGLDTLCS